MKRNTAFGSWCLADVWALDQNGLEDRPYLALDEMAGRADPVRRPSTQWSAVPIAVRPERDIPGKGGDLNLFVGRVVTP